MTDAPIRTFVGKIKIMELYSDHLTTRFIKLHGGTDHKHMIFYDQITAIHYSKATFLYNLGRIVIERLGEHGIKNALSMNAIEFVRNQNLEASEVKADIERLILDYRRNI